MLSRPAARRRVLCADRCCAVLWLLENETRRCCCARHLTINLCQYSRLLTINSELKAFAFGGALKGDEREAKSYSLTLVSQRK